MDQDFENSQTQSRPVPPPDAQRRTEEIGARETGGTREQIHNLSKPDEHDKTREQIHNLSEPSEHDRTREQIHNLSKESEHDSTRESIRNMKDWTLSEAIGLPLLSGDKPSDSRRRSSLWGGKPSGDNQSGDNASGARSGWTLEDEPPQPFRPGQSPLAHFSKNDRYAFFAAAAMTPPLTMNCQTSETPSRIRPAA